MDPQQISQVDHMHSFLPFYFIGSHTLSHFPIWHVLFYYFYYCDFQSASTFFHSLNIDQLNLSYRCIFYSFLNKTYLCPAWTCCEFLGVHASQVYCERSTLGILVRPMIADMMIGITDNFFIMQINYIMLGDSYLDRLHDLDTIVLTIPSTVQWQIENLVALIRKVWYTSGLNNLNEFSCIF